MENLVHESDTRRLVRELFWQLNMDLPYTLGERRCDHISSGPGTPLRHDPPIPRCVVTSHSPGECRFADSLSAGPKNLTKNSLILLFTKVTW